MSQQVCDAKQARFLAEKALVVLSAQQKDALMERILLFANSGAFSCTIDENSFMESVDWLRSLGYLVELKSLPSHLSPTWRVSW